MYLESETLLHSRDEMLYTTKWHKRVWIHDVQMFVLKSIRTIPKTTSRFYKETKQMSTASLVPDLYVAIFERLECI